MFGINVVSRSSKYSDNFLHFSKYGEKNRNQNSEKLIEFNKLQLIGKVYKEFSWDWVCASFEFTAEWAHVNSSTVAWCHHIKRLWIQQTFEIKEKRDFFSKIGQFLFAYCSCSLIISAFKPNKAYLQSKIRVFTNICQYAYSQDSQKLVRNGRNSHNSRATRQKW